MEWCFFFGDVWLERNGKGRQNGGFFIKKIPKNPSREETWNLLARFETQSTRAHRP